MEEQSAGEEMRAAEVTLVDANEDGNSMQDAGEEENTAPVVVEKDEEDNIPIIRKEKKKRSRFFDDEASESDDGEDGTNKKKRGKIESDDEDVGPNEYEEDGFVVKDDADEDDGDDEDSDGLDDSSDEEQEGRRLKKNRRKQTDDMEDLDDDDLEIAGFSQKAPAGTGLDSSDEEGETFGSNINGGVNEDNNEAKEGDTVVSRRPKDAQDGYNSMDDFIERDDDEVDSEDEEYGNERRPTVATSIGNQQDSLSFRDAYTIFGMDLDELDLGYEEEVDYTEYDEGADEQQISVAERDLRRRYDPAVLKRNFVTTSDDAVRSTDLPERLMHISGRREVDEESRVYEAKFIAKHILARRYRKKTSEYLNWLHSHIEIDGSENLELRAVVASVEAACCEVSIIPFVLSERTYSPFHTLFKKLDFVSTVGA